MCWRRLPLWLALSALFLSVDGSRTGLSDVDAPAAPPLFAGEKGAAKDGRRVDWQGWKFNWSIHPRNGLVLENVSFRGKSVLKYAGLAEVYMTYNAGEPRMEDFGDGIAERLLEIYPGKDCVPGSLSCQAFNAEGREEGKRVVMMHEEGLGLTYIGTLGRAYGKQLILWCAYSLDGYYYIGRWRFRDDGCLFPEMGMTGALFHTSKGDANAWGSRVGKDNVYAPSHVHNLLWCLDFDIDGPDGNIVEEFNYVHDKPGSKTGKHSWSPILKETSRPTNSVNFRFWRVVNPASKNALGLPRSYEILPGGNGIYRGGTDEKLTHAEFWVTRHHPKEHPADMRPLSVILPKYLSNESVDRTNVVVWYGLHAHHIPRTEDWPGMPAEWVGFAIRPRDFLDVSPVTPK